MGKRRRKGWMCTMNFCLRQLGTLEFWETLLDSFGNLGPIAPIMLAMVESFFPPLPLIAIVALNVAAHGGILGFLYSWAGVALVSGLLFQKLSSLRLGLRLQISILAGHLVGSVVINSLALHIFYGYQWPVLAARIPNAIVLSAVNTVLVRILLENKALAAMIKAKT